MRESSLRDGFVVAVAGCDLKVETGNPVPSVSRSDRCKPTASTDRCGCGGRTKTSEAALVPLHRSPADSVICR